MKDAGTQVYWHQIPGAPPPWKDKEEQEKMFQISKSIIGRISDQRHVCGLSRKQILTIRCRLRHKNSICKRHWGAVIEPHLGPLLGVNLIMRELLAEEITREEAEKVVGEVVEEHEAMSQLFDNTQGSMGGQDTMRGSNAAQAMDVQVAPFLEVVKRFCKPRNLNVSEWDQNDFNRKGRILSSDLECHKRVLMVIDRREPHFLFALPVTKKKNFSADRKICYMQLFAPTAKPNPWRRLVRCSSVTLRQCECVVVVISRQDDQKNDSARDVLGRVSMERERGSCDEYDSDSGSFVSEGDQDSDGDDDEWDYGSNAGARLPLKRRRYADEYDNPDVGAGGDGDECVYPDLDDVDPYERRRIGENPIFSPDDQVRDDPLFNTPRALLRRTSRFTREGRDWVDKFLGLYARSNFFTLPSQEFTL